MKEKYTFDHTTGNGQKRLMAVSMGLDSEAYIPKQIVREANKDYGSDPIGNGMVKLVPSGRIVTAVEAVEILKRK